MRGGARQGAGRKKGSVTKRSQELVAQAAAAGVLPLDFMLKVLRQETPKDADALTQLRFDAMRFEAAKSAAPYLHPRLNAIEHTGPGGGPMHARIEVAFVRSNKG